MDMKLSDYAYVVAGNDASKMREVMCLMAVEMAKMRRSNDNLARIGNDAVVVSTSILKELEAVGQKHMATLTLLDEVTGNLAHGIATAKRAFGVDDIPISGNSLIEMFDSMKDRLGQTFNEIAILAAMDPFKHIN